MSDKTPSHQGVVERVQRYLDRLSKSRQHDQERIHAFDLGEPSEAELFVSDLRALVSAAAPAPSSLAGGEVDVRTIAFTAMNEMRRSGESYEMCARWISERVNSALAALSPEAPEREGLDWRIEYNRIEGIREDAERHMASSRSTNDPVAKSDHETQANAAMKRYDREVARFNALTPRHEAPASEGEAS